MAGIQVLSPAFRDPLFSRVAVFLPFQDLFGIISLVCSLWSKGVFSFSRVRLNCGYSTAVRILRRLNLSTVKVVEIYGPCWTEFSAIAQQFVNAKCMCVADIQGWDLSPCTSLESLFVLGNGLPQALPQSLVCLAHRNALIIDHLCSLPHLRVLGGVTSLPTHDDAAILAKLNIDIACFEIMELHSSRFTSGYSFKLVLDQNLKVPLSDFEDHLISSLREVALHLDDGVFTTDKLLEFAVCKNLQRLVLYGGESVVFIVPDVEPPPWPQLQEIALFDVSLDVLRHFTNAGKLKTLMFDEYTDALAWKDLPHLPHVTSMQFDDCASEFINGMLLAQITHVTIFSGEFTLCNFRGSFRLRDIQLSVAIKNLRVCLPSWNVIPVEIFQGFLDRHSFTEAVCDISLEMSGTRELFLQPNLTLTLPRTVERKLVCNGHVLFNEWPNAHKVARECGNEDALREFDICAKAYSL